MTKLLTNNKVSVDIQSHDLNLPEWGPYSKRYGGISHTPDLKTGLRFDLAIMPGYYRRQMIVPNEKWASGQHAWEASSDLDYYSYRYEIEWKDQVYCDVSFSKISKNARLIRSHFVNNTDLAQDLMTHLVASMNFPPVRPYCDDWIKMVEIERPKDSVWIDALDYEDLKFTNPRPSDGLVEDGLYRAEIREHGLTNGNGIGCDFGKDKGDQVRYRFRIDKQLDEAKLTLRYRLGNKKQTKLKLIGLKESEIEIMLNQSETDQFGFTISSFYLGHIDSGNYSITLFSEENARLDLDGLGVLPNKCDFAFNVKNWQFTPEIIDGPNTNSIILKYGDTSCYYGIAWDYSNSWIRQLFNNELDSFMRQIVPDHMSAIKHGPGEGHYTDIFLRPINLPPKSTSDIYAMVCSGDKDEVVAQLDSFSLQTKKEYHRIFEETQNTAISFQSTSKGETFHFSQERMAATEMLNVVYPVYTRKQFIKHSTPGKWWDCLYTWDSGFIGLALLELDNQRAIENLNAYLTPSGDEHAAFIHHGSPVPTQMYLFLEIWNQTQDLAMLEFFYSSLRQYYQYLAGNIGGSTTRELNSNLLRTWEYFFDSGGWDDYPAQLHTLEFENPDLIACSSITAHVLRSAKILKFAAQHLNLKDHLAGYERDIEMFTNALQDFAWDKGSGYFSYVTHDESGEANGHLMHESGANFNMGLDGVLPLFAGACTTEQENLLLNRLQDPERFWTNIGLSTVDQTAPYYRKDGYWNGAVWMPQQWFIWKTALDMGNGELAFQIADTALKLWKSEVESSYYCFEHFLIASERGTGWHQFGGLSSPVIPWFNAYYKTGRITVGMEIWIKEQDFGLENTRFDGVLFSSQEKSMTIIINLNESRDYQFICNDKSIKPVKLVSGSYNLLIAFKTGNNYLSVKPID